MSEHSTPKQNYESLKKLSNLSSCFSKNQSLNTSTSPLSYCKRHSLLNVSGKGIKNFCSPSLNESKSPLHRWTPTDRLRLIQILQELHFDNVISVLPDNYTYEDLASCSLENLHYLFAQCLREPEICLLYSRLHSNCGPTENANDRNFENFKLESNDNLELILPKSSTFSNGGDSDLSNSLFINNSASSVPSNQCCRSSNDKSSSFFFCHKFVDTGLSSTANHQDKLFNRDDDELILDKSIHSPASGQNLFDRGCSVSPSQISAHQDASGRLLQVSLLRRPLQFDLQSSPSSILNFPSNSESHSIRSNLLRMKRSFIGQSAPNLLYCVRDSTLNDHPQFHYCSHALPPCSTQSINHTVAAPTTTVPVDSYESDQQTTNQHVSSHIPAHCSSFATNDLLNSLNFVSSDLIMSSPTTAGLDSPLMCLCASDDTTAASSSMRSKNGRGDQATDTNVLTGYDEEKANDVSANHCETNTSSNHHHNHHYRTLLNDKQSCLPRLRLDSKYLIENRRWSLVSLPSSGYGTNASESGSHLSRSRCSSKENFHLTNTNPLSHSQTTTQQTILSNIHSNPTRMTNLVQTSLRSSLPIERSASFRSSCTRAASKSLFTNFASPIHGNSPSSSSIGRSPTGESLMFPKYLTHSLSPALTPPLSVIGQPQATAPSSDCKLTPGTTKSLLQHSTAMPGALSVSGGGMLTRSHSLSPSRMSVGCEQEILLLNHLYRERFPKASAHMQDQLTSLVDEMEHADTVCWSAVARFVHFQVVQYARDCLQKAVSGLVTCRYFYEMTENLSKLVEDTRTRDPDSVELVTAFIHQLLLIIARPARLLECLEFDPSEFYQMLEVAEDEVRRSCSRQSSQSSQNSAGCAQILSANVPMYIISKLGLNKSDLDDDDSVSRAAVDPVKVDPVTQRKLSIATFDSDNHDDVSPNCVTLRPPCEADFEVIKLISNGAYGVVYLVRHKITKQRFSMKKIRKHHLQLRNQVEQVFAERDIMSFADNPFVVSLCCTFETKKCLCMVMEYVEGGDVATLLKHIGGPVPMDLARMYFAETVLALEYLHNYGIVHRDLKPDNLLITHEGHIKLTDFGLSRIGLMNLATNLFEKNIDVDKDCKMFRDKQVFGTPEYIAPEVILRQGYGKPVDWWSMGIMLYEFLVGCVPFYGDTIEELFANIVSAPIDWPNEDEWKVVSVATDIITKLLERDPLLRLGTLSGAAEVKEAAFFTVPTKVDWNNLLRQKAAFVPQLEHDEDTSYFDPRSDRYHHDVENDEDVCLPTSSFASRSRSCSTQSFGGGGVMTSRLSNCYSSPPEIVCRRPAASRLSRRSARPQLRNQQHQKQSTNKIRRCHSLGWDLTDVARRYAKSSSDQPSSHRSSQTSVRSPSEVCGATLTAHSVASRNALHLLQTMYLHASDNHLSSTSLATTGDKMDLNVEVDDRVDDDAGCCPTSTNDSESRLFQSFASYSPRFSVVFEQARLGVQDGDWKMSDSGANGDGEKVVATKTESVLKAHDDCLDGEYHSESCEHKNVDSNIANNDNAQPYEPINTNEETVVECPDKNKPCDACDNCPTPNDSVEILPKSTLSDSDTSSSSSSSLAFTTLPSSVEQTKSRTSIPRLQSQCFVQPHLMIANPHTIGFVPSDVVINSPPPPSLSSAAAWLSSPSVRPMMLAQSPMGMPHSPSAPCQSLVINKGKCGFGFTIRAIRVFWGRTDVYTLYHLVMGVDVNGPAARAGLKESDLILNVNDMPTIGLYHTEVVKIILQSGSVLRIHTISLNQTSIRSDGPWRPAGRFVSRAVFKPNRLASSTHQYQYRHHKQKTPPPLQHGVYDIHNHRRLILSKGATKSPPHVRHPEASPGHLKRHLNRRLTIREARGRHVASVSQSEQQNMANGWMQADVGYCRVPVESAGSWMADRVRMTQSVNCQATVGQRLGSTAVTHSSTPSSYFLGHRRSLEKPLIRQLSERQHKNMLTSNEDFAVGGTSSNYIISHPLSYHTPQPTQPSSNIPRLRPDYSIVNQSLNKPLLTVGSGNTHSSPGWYSASDSLAHTSPPGSTSLYTLNSVRLDVSRPPPNCSQLVSNNMMHRAPPSITQFSHTYLDEGLIKQQNSTNVGRLAPTATTTSTNTTTTTTTTTIMMNCPGAVLVPSTVVHCRHSDPIRPVGFSAIQRPTDYTSTQITLAPTTTHVSSLSHVPTSFQPSKDSAARFSVEVNALVQSGQVRLRRHSHRFAVKHVTSPCSPVDSTEERLSGDKGC